MAFPNSKTLEKMRKKLEKAEPTRQLPENPTKAEKLKYDLCKQFVKYLLKHKISQKQLAEQLEIEPARLNEIVKYRIDLFTIDRLLDYAERLKPSLRVSVS